MNFSILSYFYVFYRIFCVKETKNGNKEEILAILETFTDIIPEKFVEEIRLKKKRLFDELGSGGWNALHFAVFYGKIEICAIFLERWR